MKLAKEALHDTGARDIASTGEESSPNAREIEGEGRTGLPLTTADESDEAAVRAAYGNRERDLTGDVVLTGVGGVTSGKRYPGV